MKNKPQSDVVTGAMHVRDQFTKYAQGFVTSRAPRVLIRMEGCNEVIFNQAHKNEFGKFIDGPGQLATTDEQALSILDGADKISEEQWHNRGMACYCYPMGAAVALIGVHCVFDRSLAALNEHNASQSATGNIYRDTAAFLTDSDSPHAYREYRLFRSTIRRLERSHGAYLDSELREMVGLHVRVHTISSTDTGVPNELKTEILLADQSVHLSEAFPVRNDEGYNRIYDAFSGTISEIHRLRSNQPELSDETILSQAKQWLLEQVDGIVSQTKIEKYAVSGFVNGIFGSAEKASRKRISEVTSEIARLQSRLFDAIVLADEVVRNIPNLIVNLEHTSETSTIKP